MPGPSTNANDLFREYAERLGLPPLQEIHPMTDIADGLNIMTDNLRVILGAMWEKFQPEEPGNI